MCASQTRRSIWARRSHRRAIWVSGVCFCLARSLSLLAYFVVPSSTAVMEKILDAVKKVRHHARFTMCRALCVSATSILSCSPNVFVADWRSSGSPGLRLLVGESNLQRCLGQIRCCILRSAGVGNGEGVFKTACAGCAFRCSCFLYDELIVHTLHQQMGDKIESKKIAKDAGVRFVSPLLIIIGACVLSLIFRCISSLRCTQYCEGFLGRCEGC